MTDSEKIDFLGGEVDALLAFASSIIKTHPDPRALEAAYFDSKERQAAMTLASPASDAFVQGQDQIRDRLKRLFLAAALERKDT